MKKNKNFVKLGLFLSMLALVVLPFVSFAQDDFDDYANCPSGNYDDCFGDGSGGSNTNSSNSTGGSSSGTSCSDIYNGEGGFEGLVDYFVCVLARSIVPLLFALALVVFLWGVTQFIMNSADENKRAQGKQFMVWGIIGLFVMFSVWGLVLLLRNTVNPGAGDDLFIPALPPQE